MRVDDTANSVFHAAGGLITLVGERVVQDNVLTDGGGTDAGDE